MQVKIITYILDDDKDELQSIVEHLKVKCEVELQAHSNPEEFIEAIQEGCHIAIIDFRLKSKMDGIEVGRLVLEKNPLCYLIMYTGDAERKTLLRALNGGFRAFVDKNEGNAIHQIAEIVNRELVGIKLRIDIFEKYAKRITPNHDDN